MAATYLCRSAAKARFDNRQPPEGVSKEGGPQPSLFGRFKERGFLRKGGNRNPPFLKPFFGYFLSGKKVTRRRHPAPGRGTPLPFGEESNPPEATKKKERKRINIPRRSRGYLLYGRSPMLPATPHAALVRLAICIGCPPHTGINPSPFLSHIAVILNAYTFPSA